MTKPKTKLSHKKRYLQIALNSTLDEAYKIINQIPVNERILIEAGTPLIKKYGEAGIRQIRQWYDNKVLGGGLGLPFSSASYNPLLEMLGTQTSNYKKEINSENISSYPYIVADLKTMDRAQAEVNMAANAGASAAIAIGSAPIETLNSFIEECEKNNLDSMIDMMNIEYPLSILSALKKRPTVVILHRGVDEEKFNKEKMIPLHEIRRIKGRYDLMISIAGGDTLREVQRSIFNDADIVVIWKSVYQSSNETAKLVEGFLKEIK